LVTDVQDGGNFSTLPPTLHPGIINCAYFQPLLFPFFIVLFSLIFFPWLSTLRLLKHGAEAFIEVADSNGMMPLHHAATCGRTRAIQLLVEAKPQV
jgi:hypothetical protein